MHNICILNYTKTALSTTIAANIRQRIPKKPSQIDHPHNLATRQRTSKQKHNTICDGHHNAQANTHIT